MISISPYQRGDYLDLRAVFSSAIHTAGQAHYTSSQLNAWAPKAFELNKWQAKMDVIQPFMAWKNNQLVGYADVQQDGYINHFYVHGKYQKMGIAKQLMACIKAYNYGSLYSHVSLSAYAFFESEGFTQHQKKTVIINDIALTNFLMLLKAPKDLNQ